MDLNADLGEVPGDEALLEIVTSANVACGFHAGDSERMRQVLARAAELGVVVGAHVSYRDRENFGRLFVDVAAQQLASDIAEQVVALRAASVFEGQLRYVKPHGALYHACSTHPVQGDALADACGALPILAGAATPFLARLGARGLAEGFVDRAYNDDATLVDRREPGAVLHDPGRVVDQAVQLAVDGSVTTITGKRLQLRVDSLCVHGDTPGATALAARVRDALVDAGVTLTALA